MASVEFAIPNLWIVVSMVGLFITLVGTGLLAATSTPWWEERREKQISNTYEKAAEGAVHLLSKTGRVEQGDPSFELLTQDLQSKEEDGEIQRIEWLDDQRTPKIKFVMENNEKTGHAGNIRKVVERGKERRINQNAIAETRYGLEFVVLGFLFQFLSMIFRHVILVSF